MVVVLDSFNSKNFSLLWQTEALHQELTSMSARRGTNATNIKVAQTTQQQKQSVLPKTYFLRKHPANISSMAHNDFMNTKAAQPIRDEETTQKTVIIMEIDHTHLDRQEWKDISIEQTL